ncbi:MAG: YihA family ribosome biogenesis GTP-binding protein [Nitrospirae bacterium]|nr:YihA family ribosome biogenesis GTP-binding protein [Nitrospirota bacterium]
MKIVKAEFVKSCVELSDCPKDDLPEIAVVGRSNVGKSSLLNCLLQRKGLAKTSSTPGKTRLINFFRVALGLNPPLTFYIVDLPGYGYAKASMTQREEWGGMVEDFLAHRPSLRGLVVLLDIRREPSPLDEQLLLWIQSYKIPVILVATKSDQLPRSRQSAALQHVHASLPPSAENQGILLFSSKTGQGREDLIGKIIQILQG